ncbi:MAG: exosome complex RNA-binding protein Rrp4 [Candidatus Odinarchaeota archaeon]
MTLIVDHYDFVTPGDKLATGGNYTTGVGVYKVREGKETAYYSCLIGLVSVKSPPGRSSASSRLSIIPMQGPYVPTPEDVVIGKIITVGHVSWLLDIRAPYVGLLSASSVLDRRYHDRDRPLHLDRYLNIGDYVMAKIVNVDRSRDPVLSMYGDRRFRKFNSGRVIEITPVKVPRIIGKNRSMINMIIQETKAQIEIGKNGRILINTDSFPMEQLVIETIRKIERESHVSGLTDRIKEFLVRRKQEMQDNGA